MKKLILLFIIASTYGCGVTEDLRDHLLDTHDDNGDPRQFQGVDSRVSVHYNRFIQIYGSAKKTSIGIMEDNLFNDKYGEEVVGVCIRWKSNRSGRVTHREIVLRTDFVNYNLSDSRTVAIAQIKAAYLWTLIAHELGHCALNRTHENGKTRSKEGNLIHKSIMNSYLISGISTFNDNFEYYTEELKNPEANIADYSDQFYFQDFMGDLI